jgi:hypothetical protein
MSFHEGFSIGGQDVKRVHLRARPHLIQSRRTPSLTKNKGNPTKIYLFILFIPGDEHRTIAIAQEPVIIFDGMPVDFSPIITNKCCYQRN